VIELLKLTALVLGCGMAVALVLYVSPFGGCHGCPGKTCRRCHGLGRYQRHGSRTVHRVAANIRAEIERTRAERITQRNSESLSVSDRGRAR
jgi:hypothetical protein